MNLAPRDPKERTAQVRRIKEWARELLFVPPETTLMVTELACTEPGCPPLETIVAVLVGPRRAVQYKVHRALEEVTREDIEELRNPPDSCNH